VNYLSQAYWQVGHPLLEESKVPRPDRGKPKSCTKVLQADKGYDSRKLRQKIKKKGVRPIIPCRQYDNPRKRPGKKPPELIDRFKVERCFAWLKGKFRRLSVKCERSLKIWNAFLRLGITMIRFIY